MGQIENLDEENNIGYSEYTAEYVPMVITVLWSIKELPHKNESARLSVRRGEDSFRCLKFSGFASAKRPQYNLVEAMSKSY